MQADASEANTTNVKATAHVKKGYWAKKARESAVEKAKADGIELPPLVDVHDKLDSDDESNTGAVSVSRNDSDEEAELAAAGKKRLEEGTVLGSMAGAAMSGMGSMGSIVVSPLSMFGGSTPASPTEPSDSGGDVTAQLSEESEAGAQNELDEKAEPAAAEKKRLEEGTVLGSMAGAAMSGMGNIFGGSTPASPTEPSEDGCDVTAQLDEQPTAGAAEVVDAAA